MFRCAILKHTTVCEDYRKNGHVIETTMKMFVCSWLPWKSVSWCFQMHHSYCFQKLVGKNGASFMCYVLQHLKTLLQYVSLHGLPFRYWAFHFINWQNWYLMIEYTVYLYCFCFSPFVLFVLLQFTRRALLFGVQQTFCTFYPLNILPSKPIQTLSFLVSVFFCFFFV